MPMTTIRRIPEDRHLGGPRHRLLEQLQQFHVYLETDDTDAREVPAWPGKAGDEPAPHRIPDLRHHNGNRAGRLLSGMARLGPHGDKDIDLELDQLRSEVGEPIVSALGPAILNGNGLSFNIAALAQALAEGFCIRPGCVTDIANPGDPGARLRLGDERRYEQTQGERNDESNSAAPPHNFLLALPSYPHFCLPYE